MSARSPESGWQRHVPPLKPCTKQAITPPQIIRRFMKAQHTQPPEDREQASRFYSPHEVIFREGSFGDSAFIIENGQVEISTLVDGQRRRLAVLGPGELFGEMALVDQGVRTASAIALTDVHLVAMSPGYVKFKMEQADPLVSLFLRVIMDRFRHWHDRVVPGAIPLQTRPRTTRPAYEEDRVQVVEAMRLSRDLETALKDHQFELFFQPIVRFSDHSVVGFEALVRWFHPERGLVPPGSFIGLAEETGLIVPLGLEVLKEAGRALQRLQSVCGAPGHSPLFMSINVSPRQVAAADFMERFETELTREGVALSNIKLEITESLLMEDPERASLTLEMLKRLGVQISVDDFGTGYSSLSYLHRFPIDSLKVDRSFVASMRENGRSMEIVRAIVGLAHALDIAVVAEGVEEAEQGVLLEELGCEWGQGYFFGRPQPESTLRAQLSALGGKLTCSTGK